MDQIRSERGRAARLGALCSLVAMAITTLVSLSVAPVPAAAEEGEVRITEWMYDGDGGEFVELTNVGSAPVDLTGWTYDDDSADPSVGFDLSPLGTIEAGESVVFVEAEAEAFRADWGLCAGIAILGGYTNNLGRADQINIFDATDTLADRLTYGDNTIGGPRTTGASAWVTPAGLGADDPTLWTLSTVGDTEGSTTSTNGAIGSPGHSTQATTDFDPCTGPGPVLVPDRPIVIGSIGDPTNPTATLTVTPSTPDVAAEDVALTVATTDDAVLPAANITISGTGAERTVAFDPVGRGTTTVTFTAEEPGGATSSASVTYAASNAAPDPAGRYLHGVSDVSSVLDVGDGHVLVVGDETNTIYLYAGEGTSAPVRTWTFTAPEMGTSAEVDVESVARAGDTLLWFGSHGNNRSGEVREERRTLFATAISGSGADTDLTFTGRYTSLWEQLRDWDATDGHGLGADALGFVAASAPGILPNAPDGFNIEGFEMAPDGTTGYLGFRAPTIEHDGEHHALIVPVTNVLDLAVALPGTTPAQLGDPILLDLDGRSIRELRRNDQGDYLISAGPSPQNDTWALYAWDGNPDSPAVWALDLPGEDALTGGTWESIAAVPHPLVAGATVRLVTDSGDTDFYGTGQAKDLSPLYQKAYTQPFTLTGPNPDEDDVRRAYDAVLRRPADPAGLVYWTDRLAAGTAPLAVSEALARSTEGRHRLVHDAYDLVLGRAVDLGGRDYWATRLGSGLPADGLVAELFASSEAHTRAGGTPDGVARLLYQVHLGREANEAGLTYWTDRLAASDTPAHRRSASLAMGRTAEADTTALRRATDQACGAGAPLPADPTALRDQYVATGRDAVRLRAAVLALHCPDGA